MITIFHGNDTSAIQKQVKAWKEGFYQKNPDSTNLTEYTPEQIHIPNLISELKSIPFLEDKRLYILHQFADTAAKEDQDKLALELSNLPDTTILLITSHKKLPKTTNPIRKHALKIQKKQPDLINIQEFTIKEKDLPKTIHTILGSYGKTINPNQSKTLTENLGKNPQKIETESHKLGLYSLANQPSQTNITDQQINQINSFTTETNVFQLIDNITNHQQKQARQKLQQLINNGEDLFKILYLIIRQFRLLIQLKSLHSQGLSQDQITKQTKLHPFVVKKTLQQTNKFTENQILNKLNQLLQIDRSIKTGNIKHSIKDQTQLAQSIEAII